MRFVCSVLLWCKYNSMRDFRCLYSSVVERQSCKLKVLRSIPSGGCLLGKIATTANEHTGCSGTIAKLPVLLAIRPHGTSLRDALPGRLDLPTLRLAASRSNQLSYGSNCTFSPPTTCISTGCFTRSPGLHWCQIVLAAVGQYCPWRPEQSTAASACTIRCGTN